MFDCNKQYLISAGRVHKKQFEAMLSKIRKKKLQFYVRTLFMSLSTRIQGDGSGELKQK